MEVFSFPLVHNGSLRKNYFNSLTFSCSSFSTTISRNICMVFAQYVGHINEIQGLRHYLSVNLIFILTAFSFSFEVNNFNSVNETSNPVAGPVDVMIFLSNTMCLSRTFAP
jgi:hypothetical protein